MAKIDLTQQGNVVQEGGAAGVGAGTASNAAGAEAATAGAAGSVTTTGKKKVDTKALIQSGAFAAIYVVLMLVIVMGSAMINPLFYILSPLTVGIVTGTVYVLSVLKVKSFIPALVMGVLFLLMAGASSLTAAIITVCSVAVACVILIVGKYRSKLVYCASFVAFNFTMAAPFSMLAYARDTFVEMAGSYYGETYATQLAAVTPEWIFPAIVGLALVGGLIGAFVASKLVDKHFKKAGIV